MSCLSQLKKLVKKLEKRLGLGCFSVFFLFQFKKKDISTCIKGEKTECYEMHYNLVFTMYGCVCTRCGFHKPLIHVSKV